MKKHLKIICVVFILFILLIPSVKADRGDLRFNVTEVSVNESKITFKGWAFIHRTNNYRTVYKNGDKDSTVVASGGGQTIKIAAYKNGNTLIEEKLNPENKYNSPNYNFYYEHFYKTGVSISNTYNGGLSTTSCGTWCYYQDMSFEITFDTSKWEGISTSDSISFKISATNNSYGKWETADVYALQKNVKGTGENPFLKINKNELTNVVRMIVINGRVQRKTSSGGLEYENVYGANGQYYMIAGAGDNSIISTPQWYPKTNGQEIIPIYVQNRSNCTYSSYDGNSDGCYPGTCSDSKNCSTTSNIKYVYSSYVLPAGKLEIKLKEDKKCPISAPAIDKLQCNNTGNINSTCNELTVSYNGSTADVKVEETGVITNLLTPTKIFDGGGFHMGIMYYNTLKWSCVSGNCDNNIKEAMNQKLKTIDSFKSGINLDNVVFNEKAVDRGLFIKNCNQNGTFTNGNTLTTICTFFLPKSTKDFNGKIIYGQGIDYGINNKYYTDFNYSGDYPISFDIVGMDRLTSTSVEKDSNVNGKAWTGNWKISFNKCNINVYRKMYNDPNSEDSGYGPQGNPAKQSLSYKYTYRPIDVTNPFPKHYAGLNWRQWYYESSSNRERIANSYDRSNLEYQITMDVETIRKIQEYNSLHNYGDWDGIYGADPDKKKSKFVDDYNMRVGD